MTDQELESLLRKAPKVPTPDGLLERLQSDIALPRRTKPVDGIHGQAWLRRWIPAGAFVLAAAAVIGVQGNAMLKVRKENEALRAAAAHGETLRRENAEYQRLQAENQELERLRKDFKELEALRVEVARLRGQVQESQRLRAEIQNLRSQPATAAAPGYNEQFFSGVDNAKDKAQSIQCVNNLKQIGLAARIWATDNGDVLPPDFLCQSNELSTPKILVCPSDTARTPAPNWASFSAANVTYEYLNPNGSETEPAVVLARCPIHNHVCLSDGSVQQLGQNRSVVMKEGKYYVADASGRLLDTGRISNADAENAMRKRYGLPPGTGVGPPANAATNAANYQYYQRLMMERYGLVPPDTNKPASHE
jgi:hypothetical protein